MGDLINSVTCQKCHSKDVFSKRAGSLLDFKDKNKNKLDQEHLNHLFDNMFICQNLSCKTEQCKSCQAIPYHLGLDCNEFKRLKQCKYCNSVIPSEQRRKEEQFQNICKNEECTLKLQFACNKILQCGHSCYGFKDETKCPPCLSEKCAHQNPDLKGVTEKQFCNICQSEELQSAPIIQSKCGHIFHYECIDKYLEINKLSKSIIFNYCLCPLCRQWLELPPNSKLSDLIEKKRKLFMIIQDKALKRLFFEKREKDQQLTQEVSNYFNKPTEYAMDIYSYCMCFKCENPYFAGLKDCQRNINDDTKEFKASDLICLNCSGSKILNCPTHGNTFLGFKCRFCCSVASWDCSNVHYCDPCHANGGQQKKCLGKEGCAFNGDHKPNGEETPLGCTICMSINQLPSDF